MSERPTRLAQTILDGADPALDRPINTVTIHYLDIAASDLVSVFNHSEPIGISPGYSAAGTLISLAIADDKICRIIEFSQPKKRANGKSSLTPKAQDVVALQQLQDHILCRTAGDIFAFDMGPLAMSLYCDLGGLRITNAVDIQSAFSAVDRKPLTGIAAALGTTVKIMKENVTNVFFNPIYDKLEDRNCTLDLAQRAWVSQYLVRSGNGAEMFEKVTRIDTKKLDAIRLDIIAKIATDALRLDQKKPLQTTHNFNQSYDANRGGVRLGSSSYKNRIRSDRSVRMEVSGQGGRFSTSGVMGGVVGRSGNVITDPDLRLDRKLITSVTSIGRDDPTTAEAQRAATILRILQGSEKLLDESPWIQNIWFPLNDNGLLTWPKEWSEMRVMRLETPSQSPPPTLPLNSSQRNAVNTMFSNQDDHRITLIQGPPGTGKTSVIAAFVQRAVRSNKGGIWLVAQSNVAVKNIAEKLMSIGFENWKLLVSKDFHLGWHEHLYTKVQNHMVRSDTFNKPNLKDCHVILCTLSMLSHPRINKFTKEIPFETMVIDEASQIEVGNYISIFANFKHSLRKLCFIGDDKQLPPFGQEDLQDLQSIFEISHLRKRIVFLDTQYRMPPQIGDIISDLVYENKLKSNPLHPISNDTIACYFVNALGKEESLSSGSYVNEVEATHILHLAKKLQEQEQNYRIITGYEGQRSHIEDLMKDEGLEWGDKCFTVDSFQGNEEDFIIISIVRTMRLGFLSDLRRTNVMLSRCKKGMFIVSTPHFLTKIAKDSLIGQFVGKVSNPTWLTLEDIQGEKFWGNEF